MHDDDFGGGADTRGGKYLGEHETSHLGDGGGARTSSVGFTGNYRHETPPPRPRLPPRPRPPPHLPLNTLNRRVDRVRLAGISLSAAAFRRPTADVRGLRM